MSPADDGAHGYDGGMKSNILPRVTSTLSAFVLVCGASLPALSQGAAPVPTTPPTGRPPAGQPPASAQPPSPASHGWTVLFDGTSTEHWRGFKKDTFPDKGWSIEDGALKVASGGGGGDIVTVEEYGDFELQLEFKVAPGANSGIMYRVTEAYDWPWMTGPEFQILDDAVHADGKNPLTSVGSVYALYAPGADKAVNPPGEWNTATIRVEGGTLTHALNGKAVVECRMDGQEWKDKIAASKFKDMPGFGIQARGRIALQDHGDNVWFRNIRVRSLELPSGVGRAGAPKGDVPSVQSAGLLFNGTDLTGWTTFSENDAGAEPVWSVKDGVLVCRGTPAGYIKTEKSYKDFVLTLEWRWNPETKVGGNSGVLLRVNGPDKVWPRSVEAQLQSGSAGDFWNIGEMAMTTDAARLNGRNTKKMMEAEKPVGEWNRYVISCIGDKISLKVNGALVNEATGVEIVAGPIALQSEGTEIQFRQIAIAEVKPKE